MFKNNKKTVCHFVLDKNIDKYRLCLHIAAVDTSDLASTVAIQK